MLCSCPCNTINVKKSFKTTTTKSQKFGSELKISLYFIIWGLYMMSNQTLNLSCFCNYKFFWIFIPSTTTKCGKSRQNEVGGVQVCFWNLQLSYITGFAKTQLTRVLSSYRKMGSGNRMWCLIYHDLPWFTLVYPDLSWFILVYLINDMYE